MIRFKPDKAWKVIALFDENGSKMKIYEKFANLREGTSLKIIKQKIKIVGFYKSLIELHKKLVERFCQNSDQINELLK